VYVRELMMVAPERYMITEFLIVWNEDGVEGRKDRSKCAGSHVRTERAGGWATVAVRSLTLGVEGYILAEPDDQRIEVEIIGLV
jgi:hypothetical protein